jgi:hypothetical protein
MVRFPVQGYKLMADHFCVVGIVGRQSLRQ